MIRLSIRRKLTLWYGGVTATILAGAGVSVLLMTQAHMIKLCDAALAGALEGFANEVSVAGAVSELPSRLDRAHPFDEGLNFRVITARGATLYRTRYFHLGIYPESRRPPTDRTSFETILRDYGSDVERFRLASRVVSRSDGPVIVQVIGSLAVPDRALNDLRSVLLLIGPTALAAALAGGYWLARRSLEPVDWMTAAASEITSMRLNRRLAASDPDDELGRLASTLNGMIERLERSFDEVRRFTADAAHELRTPLTLIRNEIEVALHSPADALPDGFLEELLEEIERLTRLVAQLLFLCREDAGIAPRAFRPVCLADTARRVSEHAQAAALDKGLSFEVTAREECRIMGDEDRLRQLLFNVLDNAIKYTPAGGAVSVRVESAAGLGRLTVVDSGIGIPEGHLSHVFERFYRVEASRSRQSEGTGLGLAICRSIAESHGGRLQLVSDVGRGTSVILTIPLWPSQTDRK